ncbi:MAG: hypothetical protein RBU30_00890 [Polyangia bacterium]|jgi:hypothetical protein|nr:hypothetical protein [Polyangia bacterium]
MRLSFGIMSVGILASGYIVSPGCDWPSVGESVASEEPCEKFARRFEICVDEFRPKYSQDEHGGKERFLAECKKSGRLRQKSKECANETGCKEMMECFFKD